MLILHCDMCGLEINKKDATSYIELNFIPHKNKKYVLCLKCCQIIKDSLGYLLKIKRDNPNV